MIDANTIKSLLKGVDVEWKKITDIFNIKNGYTPSKTNTEFWTDGDIPWFRMEDIRENGRILNNSLQKINKVAIKGGKLFPANSIIISTSATIGEHALITIPYLSNQRFTNFSLKNEFKKILNIKFVYYYFFIFSENAKKIVNISSLPSVQMTELKKWNFPILSLDVQNKIVNILDTFTALTTELTIELNARLNQYNYY
ncbi:restriction endonuclease subunit S, partial [Gilliamella apicola]